MALQQIIDFLNITVFSVAEQPVSIGDVLFIPILLVLGYTLTKWLNQSITNRLTIKKNDPNVIHLLQRIFYFIAIAILVITILDFVNVPITAFAFLSGAIVIGFGFGAQNIINNFISGWILMWERPHTDW
ncbi:MAG: small-conductance mechanosensitive channel [Alteromonadaceae bacterium]|jgi:small-conductance mechanosensitive channel